MRAMGLNPGPRKAIKMLKVECPREDLMEQHNTLSSCSLSLLYPWHSGIFVL